MIEKNRNHFKTRFSGVIITHNVASTIRPCLTALKEVCDEILVLDTNSDDGTVEICRELEVTLITQDWLGYAQTKNLGNRMARHDWILSVDADEVLSDELIRSLQNLVVEDDAVYALDRLTNYCGKWIRHSGWYPDWKIRVFNRNTVTWQGDFVHETLRIPAGFREVKLKGKLLHYSYNSPEDHLKRIRKYAALAAQEQFQRGKRPGFIKKWLSPVGRFLRTYLLKGGFMDGREGWTISRRNAYMVYLRYRLLQEYWDRSSSGENKDS